MFLCTWFLQKLTLALHICTPPCIWTKRCWVAFFLFTFGNKLRPRVIDCWRVERSLAVVSSAGCCCPPVSQFSVGEDKRPLMFSHGLFLFSAAPLQTLHLLRERHRLSSTFTRILWCVGVFPSKHVVTLINIDFLLVWMVLPYWSPCFWKTNFLLCVMFIYYLLQKSKENGRYKE